MQVNAGSDLTADHFIQTAIAIGGTVGNAGMLTIAASDATGDPISESPRNGLDAESLAPVTRLPFTVGSLDLSDVAVSSRLFWASRTGRLGAIARRPRRPSPSCPTRTAAVATNTK
jgi:hypothetical protein